jgi:hypothetical protein
MGEANTERQRITATRPKLPPAPGASVSPQHPGDTPDRSGVPGYTNTGVPRPETKRRPLSQYGTAEEVMRVYKRVPEEEIKASHFEQASSSDEEQRKAYPWLLTPIRPATPAVAAGEEAEALPEQSS